MPMHAFCSPQKDSRFTWVGLLAWRGQHLTVCRFTFPSNTLSGCLEATRPHSQWRNRAGLAPDFPVMPVMGTRGEDPYTVARCTGSSCATNAQRFFSGISNVRPGTRAPVVHVCALTCPFEDNLVPLTFEAFAKRVRDLPFVLDDKHAHDGGSYLQGSGWYLKSG